MRLPNSLRVLRPSEIGGLLMDSANQWSTHRASSKGAALALYMVFSLAPMLILVIAVAGGSLIQRLHMEDQVEPFVRIAVCAGSDAPTLTRRQRLTWARQQMLGTLKSVFPYILVGVGVGALIHNWIPQDWVTSLLGRDNPLGVVLATLVGIPMYADIFGTIPVAEALLAKGALLGTVLSFMMAVTTLSLPSLIMLRKAVRPRLLAVFVAICTAGILLVGCLFNLLAPYLI